MTRKIDELETRLHYYKNCEKIFKKNKRSCSISEKYEKEIICLPNNKIITKEYIDYIGEAISSFYSKMN